MEQENTRVLQRSRSDRMIAGVCSGLARHFGWSTQLVRIIWVALLLLAGTGILAYLILWIVMPDEKA